MTENHLDAGPGPDLPAIRTLDWIAGRQVRAWYPVLLAAATDGEATTRIYAVGLLRSLPAKDLRPWIAEIAAAADRANGSAAGPLLADLARAIAAA